MTTDPQPTSEELKALADYIVASKTNAVPSKLERAARHLRAYAGLLKDSPLERLRVDIIADLETQLTQRDATNKFLERIRKLQARRIVVLTANNEKLRKALDRLEALQRDTKDTHDHRPTTTPT